MYVSPRLSSHKASCIHSRVDIDQEDWLTINSWIEGIKHALLSLDLTIKLDYLDLTEQGENEENIYSRTHPYIATMVVSLENMFLLIVKMIIICFINSNSDDVCTINRLFY